MTEKKKKGFLQKIFGEKSGCCSIELEEVEEKKQNRSDTKQDHAKEDRK